MNMERQTKPNTLQEYGMANQTKYITSYEALTRTQDMDTTQYATRDTTFSKKTGLDTSGTRSIFYFF